MVQPDRRCNPEGFLAAVFFFCLLLFPHPVLLAQEAPVRELQDEIKSLRLQINDLDALQRRLREVEEKLTAIQKRQAEAEQREAKQEQAIGATTAYLTPFATKQPLIEKELKKVSAFEFHGYFRAGAGQNSGGGNQVCFQAPGAPVKFRLGNECEDYAELVFNVDAYRPDPAGPYFKVNTRIAFDGGWLTEYQNSQLFAPELYVEGGNLFGGRWKNATFWAGKRFYRKDQVHIDDFYFWDSSGPGAGVKDLELGVGKLAIAYFRMANVKSDIFSVQVFNPDGTPKLVNGKQVLRTVQGLSFVENDQVVSKGEVQWYEIPVNAGGTLDLGLEVRALTGSTGASTGDYGVIASMMHTQKMWGGFNQAILQYGQGLAAGIGIPSDYSAENNAKTFRIVDQILIQPDPLYSAAFVALYQNSAGEQAQPRQWLSLGMRPILNVTDHFRVALEVGTDFVYPRGGEMRRLTKVTLAPELAAGRKFFDRPVLRVFGTYAHWNRAAGDNGVVHSNSGLSPFAGNEEGMTYGVQAEAWW